MDNVANYLLIWCIYLLAAGVFYSLFWKFTDFKNWRGLAYTLRAMMLVMILTPWYVSPAESILAPALMIMTMDVITIEPVAAVRALVPLVLAMIAALLVVIVGRVLARRSKK